MKRFRFDSGGGLWLGKGLRDVPDARAGELWRVDRRPRHHRAVPAICHFCGIVIAMFFDDHGHPHFHARHSEQEAKIRIDQIEVI